MPATSAISRVWKVSRGAYTEFLRNDAFTLAAALAFYTTLSLAPLMVLLVWIGTLLGYGMKEDLSTEIDALIGSEAGASIRSIMEHSSSHPVLGSISGAISFLVLLATATGVFVQLQRSLNRIWAVEAVPHRAFHEWLRNRLVSLAMILLIGLLVPASVTVSAMLSWLFGKWLILDAGVSLMLFALLFATIFKYMPDASISWRDVLGGGFITSLFFLLGKFAIALYLGRSHVGSAYGAGGAVIILLVWIYYSSLIFFFGAELTQVRACSFGRGIVPSEYARRIVCETHECPPVKEKRPSSRRRTPA
jgi:membrane protein